MRKLITHATIKTIASQENRNSIVQSVMAYINKTDIVRLDSEKIEGICSALTEATDNVILFAYPNKPGKISVRISIYDNKTFEIKVRDWGCGIADIDTATKPLFSTDESRSGLGFVVMETFSDKLTVKSTLGKGTIVTMRFKF